MLPLQASNMNFPAPAAVLGFIAACAGTLTGASAAVIAWFIRKPRFARGIALVVGAGAAVYFGLFIGLSLTSRDQTLVRGQEKYFCEIDCHLAYSIVGVNEQDRAVATHYVVVLRTRFDETTTFPSRPKNAYLSPSPRIVRLIDARGREYVPTALQGTPLLTPLKPADAYTTQLEFDVPKDATGLRLLINTVPAWPDHMVIGDENGWLHKKTYLAL